MFSTFWVWLFIWSSKEGLNTLISISERYCEGDFCMYWFIFLKILRKRISVYFVFDWCNISQCNCNFCSCPCFCFVLVFKSVKHHHFVPLLKLKEGCSQLLKEKNASFFLFKNPKFQLKAKRELLTSLLLILVEGEKRIIFPLKQILQKVFCFSSGQHCSLGGGGGKKTLQWTVVLEICPCSASKIVPPKQFGEGRPIQQGRC